jgi:hypothetical protein
VPRWGNGGSIVVIPAATYACSSDPMKLRGPGPYWTPTEQDARKALGALERVSESVVGEHGNPSRAFAFQAAGEIRRYENGEARRIVVLNAACLTPDGNWALRWHEAAGGNQCYFRVRYDLQSGALNWTGFLPSDYAGMNFKEYPLLQ